jgi:hypothetical protein
MFLCYNARDLTKIYKGVEKMSELVRGPGMFIGFNEENSAKSVIIGVISTISRTRKSTIQLYVKGNQVSPDAVQRIHGDFREQPKIPGKENRVFNCVLFEFGFRRLYKFYGETDLYVDINIPAYNEAEDIRYNHMKINVPKRWYEELEAE